MLMFQNYKDAHRIIGYFSYTKPGMVLCEGEACIIAESEGLMQSYIKKSQSTDDEEKSIIKKTRFGEIMNGLEQGALYAFDEGSYKRFSDLTKMNGINFLDTEDKSSDETHTGIRLVIIGERF